MIHAAKECRYKRTLGFLTNRNQLLQFTLTLYLLSLPGIPLTTHLYFTPLLYLSVHRCSDKSCYVFHATCTYPLLEMWDMSIT